MSFKGTSKNPCLSKGISQGVPSRAKGILLQCLVRPEGIPSPKGCPWHGKGLLRSGMDLREEHV